MIGRVVLAALLAGIAAGLIMGLVTQFKLTPLILEAETFEVAQAGESHTHGTEASGAAASVTDDHGQARGWHQTLGTFATTALAGVGFAAALTGLSFLLGVPVTRQNGLIWGLCGFVAVSLAPAAGLPPELPGMPSANVSARQVWWLFTIVCTGAALWLALIRREHLAVAAAVVLAMVPHLVGAPQAVSHETALSAGLVQRFVASSLAANALFWALIGVFLGYALERFEKDVTS